MKKVLIITYYWPPSGGSGVQRWLFFAKYLKEFGIEPFVITVDEKKASYKVIDNSLSEKVREVKVFKTNTWEPLKIYSRILSGNERDAIPNSFVGEKPPELFQKISRFIRGNFFIPDARIGWCRFAYRKAKEVILENDIKIVITTGPPHSTHLVGLQLKKNLNIRWMADFRDPWSEIFYNRLLFKTKYSSAKDRRMEKNVLENADVVLTIGPSMKKLLEDKIKGNKNKVSYIYNGFDDEMFKSIKPEKDRNYFTITHIGILGESQPITAFLKALKMFFDVKADIVRFLKFKVVGKMSPSHLIEIKELVQELNLECIEYVPHNEAIQQMVNSDLLLNSLAETENSNILISGKLMEYIASGNPILCLGNPEGDAAELLKRFENSMVISRDDAEQMQFFIEKIFSQWKNNTISRSNPTIGQYSRFETARKLAEAVKSLSQN